MLGAIPGNRRRRAAAVPALLVAPVLSNFVAAGTFQTDLGASAVAGIIMHLRVWRDAGKTDLAQHLIMPITESEIADSETNGFADTDWTSTTSSSPPRDATTGVITAYNPGTGARWLDMYLDDGNGNTSAVSNTVTATLANPNASTQWRLRQTTQPQSSTWFAIADMYFRQTVGDAASAVVPTGVTGTAVAWNADHVAANVLDNNPATDFYGDLFSNPMVFTFASPVYIPQIQIRANAADPQSCVSSCVWERWDGSAYQPVITFAGNAAGPWTANALRTFP